MAMLIQRIQKNMSLFGFLILVCGKNDKNSLSSNKCGKLSSKIGLPRIVDAGPYCRRAGVYYADGGTVCLNEKSVDECKID